MSQFITASEQIEMFLAAHPEHSREYAEEVQKYAAIRGERFNTQSADWEYVY